MLEDADESAITSRSTELMTSDGSKSTGASYRTTPVEAKTLLVGKRRRNRVHGFDLLPNMHALAKPEMVRLPSGLPG